MEGEEQRVRSAGVSGGFLRDAERGIGAEQHSLPSPEELVTTDPSMGDRRVDPCHKLQPIELMFATFVLTAVPTQGVHPPQHGRTPSSCRASSAAAPIRRDATRGARRSPVA